MKQGDRVKLISIYHGDNEWNPVWGSKQGKILGTAFNYNDGGYNSSYTFSVDWDNGKSNNYRSRDLELYTQPVKLPDELFEL